MTTFDHTQYQPNPVPVLPDRQWPDRQLVSAPDWCSVDLRDGNQALANPMTVEQKHRLFKLLIDMGFKQIEVGFPAASSPDFDFIREIITGNKIPDDVTIQVLTQARDSLIEKTFEALDGAKKAIVHVYNSTSVIQRQQVFKMDKAGVTAIAVNGAKKVKQQARLYPETEWQFQYSPESFTQTETDFAIEVCQSVLDVWDDNEQPSIINLPATVEANSPNAYADQIEYFCRHIKQRQDVIISLHTHNDRGCGVAAAELGILAGADRIEGTLLGNGERTGNMDIITLAMNLYSQGINPHLDMADMATIVQVVESCTDIPVHPRHPYAGELVFTAFSGSHQDAIRKCLAQQTGKAHWQVAYLPINPADIGRHYDEVIRINSQSGKGGVAYVVENKLGICLPRWMQIDFSRVVQLTTEFLQKALTGDEIIQLFHDNYSPSRGRYRLLAYEVSRANQADSLTVKLEQVEEEPSMLLLHSEATGVLEAFCQILQGLNNDRITIVEYEENTTGSVNHADAHCFLKITVNGRSYGGFGHSQDVLEAGFMALLNAFNRYQLTVCHSEGQISIDSEKIA